MRTGEVEANPPRLNEVAQLAHVAELIERKRSAPERSRLNDSDLGFHRQEYERLRAELEAAQTASVLPEAPTSRGALNDVLVRLRLRQRDGTRP
jgi:hypothetical protein